MPAKKRKTAYAARENLDWFDLAVQLNELHGYFPGVSPEDVDRDNFLSKLAAFAREFTSMLFTKLKFSIEDRELLDLDGYIRNEASDDLMAQLYLQLRLTFGDVLSADAQQLYQEMRRLCPDVPGARQTNTGGRQGDGDRSMDTTWAAFLQNESRDCDDVPPSQILLREIEALSDEFMRGYFSPYTAIVLPSGTGKSYTVQQLAKSQGQWVLYASLAAASSRSHPPGSPLTRQLQMLRTRESAIQFFRSYFQIGMILVEAATSEGISPGELFDFQADKRHATFQEQLVQHTVRHQDQATVALATMALHPSAPKRPRRSAEPPHTTRVQWKACLVDNLRDARRDQPSPDNTYAAPPPGEGSRLLVCCLDEARALLARDSIPVPNNEPPLLFRAWRRALMNVSTSSHRVFGLLLDTTSRIANFVPPRTVDPSAKEIGVGPLLRPIITLPTWDVVARTSPLVQAWLHQSLPHRHGSSGSHAATSTDNEATAVDAAGGHGGSTDADRAQCARHPDGSMAFQAFLFSLGRPLWASHLLTTYRSLSPGDDENMLRLAIAHVLYLARTKTPGEGYVHSLAMMSYRLQFYVEQQDITNELTAKWMCFPVFVSDDRRYIRSIQPGEPILAATAAVAMADRTMRERFITDFSQYYSQGAVNVGDTGEIVACLLLLLAADTFLEPPLLRAPLNQRPPPATAVPLGRFLDALLGSSPPASWSVDGHSVYLTHVSRFVGNNRMRAEQLEMAFQTGQGWFFEPGFVGADLLVPVWNATGGAATGRGPMTALLIQVKNRARGPHISAARARTTLASAKKELGVLDHVEAYGLFLELRNATNVRNEDAEPRVSPVTWLDRSPEGDDILVGVAGGFSADVYPVLGDSAAITAALQAILLRGKAAAEDHLPGLRAIVDVRDGSTLENQEYEVEEFEDDEEEWEG